MGTILDFLNTSLGGQLVGGAIGMGMQSINDTRQMNQQQKLQEMQYQYEMKMGRFNKDMALEMWKDTSYPAQMEMMKKAGLNPALMYGMGGGGGQTAQTGGSAHSSGGNAPVGGGEIQSMLGMGLQMELLKAQKENIEADTKLKLTDAGYTGGPKTKNTDMDTALKNQQQYEIGLRNALQEWYQTTDEQGNNVVFEQTQAAQEKSQGLKQKVAEATGAAIRNDLMKKEIEVNDATINKMAQDIAQRAQEITIEQGHLDVAKLLAEFNTNWGNIIGKEALGVVGGIIQVFGLKRALGGTVPKAIEGFRRKSY